MLSALAVAVKLQTKVKLAKWALWITVGVVAFLILTVSAFFYQENYVTPSTANVSQAVLKYKPQISKEMKKQGLDQKWVPLVLAHVMQESGGVGTTDIFQASESIGLPRNSLSVKDSIHYGVAAMKRAINSVKTATGHSPSPTNEADVNISSVAYNVPAFVPWLKRTRGGKWSVAANNEFYIDILPLYGVGPGDKNYYKHILKYYNVKAGQLNDVGLEDIAVGKNGKMNYFDQVMKFALKYKGYPYHWGGSSPETSFDCSGLTQYVFKQVGIKLPRTAAQQYTATKRIKAKDAKAGDLVFFSKTVPGKKGITHVGIYTGNGKFYDAEDTGIKYSNLTSGYWANHFTAFGRIH